MKFALNEKPLITQREIETRLTALAGEIAADFKNASDFTVIGVLNGGFVFTADLVRLLGIDCGIDFTAVSSYVGTVSGGALTFSKEPKLDLRGRDVLIADDILDTGNTLSALAANIAARGAKSVHTAVLLDKKERRTAEFEADYVGFTIPDVFVVGYGLDCNEKWRTLPYIATVTVTE